MDMKEKNEKVIAYIDIVVRIFEKNGFHVSDEKISEVKNQYIDSPKTIDEIKREINRIVRTKLEELIVGKGEGDFRQNFNFHTHTYRSGHSDFVSDEEMVQAAKAMGITALGFTEHVPNPDLVLPDEDKRMLISETDDYIDSINDLKKAHPEMRILVGFEGEFDPMRESFLGELREKVDYMILGQHFVMNGLERVKPSTPEFPLIYADMLCKGIDSGIFDIVAHPDFFMRYIDLVETEEGRKKFAENAAIASKKICEKARDMGIPVEINLSQAASNRILADGNYHYPHPIFWKEAAKVEGLKVIRGVDAHKPKAFRMAGSAEELVFDIERMVNDKIIYGGYDPVEARKNNTKLQEAYKKNQEKALPFETNLIEYIIKRTEEKVGGDVYSENSSNAVDEALTEFAGKCVMNAENKKQKIEKEITEITNSNMDPSEKIGKLGRKRRTIFDTNVVLLNQQRVFYKLKRIGLAMAKNGIVIKQYERDPDVAKLNIHNNIGKKYGFVSTIIISIITIIVGLLIVALIYNLRK